MTPQTQSQAKTTGVQPGGSAFPMTVFSLLYPGGRYIQRLVFAVGRLIPTDDVDALAVLHSARLAVIRQFPQHGQPPDDLRQPLQLFESNYNGSFGGYIDTFVDMIPRKMRAFWGTSYGFPCSLAPGRFKGYIMANEFPIDHYYDRNAGATVKMMQSALKLAPAVQQLRREAPTLDPVAFAERFLKLVEDFQSDL